MPVLAGLLGRILRGCIRHYFEKMKQGIVKTKVDLKRLAVRIRHWRNIYMASDRLKMSVMFCLFIAFIGFMLLRGKIITDRFYKAKIHSLVVDKDTWQGRSVSFELADGFDLPFSKPNEDRLHIGDSVAKAPNTFIYKVYRKNYTSGYHFSEEFDYSIPINSVK
jgi:hypothetical protein